MRTRIRSPFAFAMLLAIAVALIAAVAFAAPRGNAGKQGARNEYFQGLAKKLNLTDAQKAEIKTIKVAHRAEVQKVMQSNLTPDQKKAKRAELRTGVQAKIDAVLTTEQRAKLKEIRAGRQETREEMSECWKSLNLTDSQMAQIKAFRADTRTQVQAIRANTTLTQQQKAAKIEEIRKANHQTVLSVLTPEQQEKLKACRKTSRAK